MDFTDTSPTSELMPPEIWASVLEYLSTPELKNSRLICPLLDVQAARKLYSSIVVAPTRHSLTSLQGITSHHRNQFRIRDLVHTVKISLNPCWKPKSYSYVGDSTEIDLYKGVTKLSPDQSPVPFAFGEFHTAIRLLDRVTSVSIGSPPRPGVSYRLDGWTQTELGVQATFSQALNLARRLPSVLEKFKIASGRMHQLPYDLFGGNSVTSRGFVPVIGLQSAVDIRPRCEANALGLSHALELDIDFGLSPFWHLKHLDIHMYDSFFIDRDSRMLSDINGLRRALEFTVHNLQSLRLVFSTAGEEVWKFSRSTCFAHRQQGNPWPTFDGIFSRLQFRRLESVVLSNVLYEPESLGKWLQHNKMTLKDVCITQWSCVCNILSANDARLLVSCAGDALDILTLEAAGNEHEELCRYQDEGMSWKEYYRINAQKMAELRLDHDLTDEQMRSAITLPIPLYIRGYHDSVPSWRTFWHRSDEGREAHYARKLVEWPTYIRHISEATSQLLAERVFLKGALVTECERIEATKIRSEPSINTISRNDDRFYVFVVNSVPGLFMWTDLGFRRYDFQNADGEDNEWLRWKRGPETDTLNALACIVNDGRGRPDDFRTYTGGLGPLQTPNIFAMPYDLELPDLEAEMTRIARRVAWEKRQAGRPKKSRKALRHERWVEIRHDAQTTYN